MKERRIISPRDLPSTSDANEARETLGTAMILWGPASGFGEFLRQNREASNLSLRKSALRIGISHTYLGQLEQADVSSQVSFEVLDKIAEAYGIEAGEVRHAAGYRYSVPEAVSKHMRERRLRDFRALLTCEEFRPRDFAPKHVDLFPPAVYRFVLDLVRKVDANARAGGPTPEGVLLRAREE